MGAILTRADVRGAKLKGINLQDAVLQKTIYDEDQLLDFSWRQREKMVMEDKDT